MDPNWTRLETPSSETERARCSQKGGHVLTNLEIDEHPEDDCHGVEETEDHVPGVGVARVPGVVPVLLLTCAVLLNIFGFGLYYGTYCKW